MLFTNPSEHAKSEVFSDADGQLPPVRTCLLCHIFHLHFNVNGFIKTYPQPQPVGLTTKMFSRKVLSYPNTCKIQSVDTTFSMWRRVDRILPSY